MHRISQPYNSVGRQWEFISLTDDISCLDKIRSLISFRHVKIQQIQYFISFTGEFETVFFSMNHDGWFQWFDQKLLSWPSIMVLKLSYTVSVLMQYLEIRAASTTVDAVKRRFASIWVTVGECASAGMALLETASTVLVSTIFDTINICTKQLMENCHCQFNNLIYNILISDGSTMYTELEHAQNWQFPKCAYIRLHNSVTFCIIQGDPHRPTQLFPTRPTE